MRTVPHDGGIPGSNGGTAHDARSHHRPFGDDVTPGELFALRWNDIRANRLRIDESVSRFEESGVKAPKTADSEAFVTLPGALAQELEGWRKSCHAVRPTDFVFPSATGTAVSEHNYERDVLVPAESEAGIMPPRVQGQAYAPAPILLLHDVDETLRPIANLVSEPVGSRRSNNCMFRGSTYAHCDRRYWRCEGAG